VHEARSWRVFGGRHQSCRQSGCSYGIQRSVSCAASISARKETYTPILVTKAERLSGAGEYSIPRLSQEDINGLQLKALCPRLCRSSVHIASFALRGDLRAAKSSIVNMKLPKELEFLSLAYRTIIYTIRQASGIRLLNNILPYSDMKLLLHVASQ
jgi:hypothetical protein